MGFSQSLANGPWYSVYSHDFGIPHPAAIAFGLSGAWPASILIRFGLHPSDAYASIYAFFLILSFYSAYNICIRLSVKRYTSILGAVAWTSMPTIWAHSSYSMLALGISLFSFYFLSSLNMFEWYTEKLNTNKVTILMYFMATIISIFMDGYTFVMFAVGSSIFFINVYVFRPELRKSLLKIGLPVHMISFIFAYILFVIYIGKNNFDAYDINFFRGWGLDLSFMMIPTQGVFWLFDLLGISLPRSDNLFFGDKSVWETTFCLPILFFGLIAWWLNKKKVELATGALIVVLFAFYMALGPSLKINSIKPESLSIDFPGQLSAGMPAELAIMPTGGSLISNYVPGFDVMRASYRWSALGIFALWLLVMIQMAQTTHKRKPIWTGILLSIVLLNLPDLVKIWHLTRDSRAMFHQIDNDLVNRLKKYIAKNEVVIFLPYGNDFIANYIAPKIGFKTYNIGGDKNLAEAEDKWPSALSENNLDLSKNDESLILKLLLTGDADVAIIPYFDMLHAAINWPCEAESLTGIRSYGPEWDKPITLTSDDIRQIEIPVASSSYSENIYISVPDATSPAASSGSPDNRALGIALRQVSLKMDGPDENFKTQLEKIFYSLEIGSKLKDRTFILSEGWYNTEEKFIWSSKVATLALPVPKVCSFGKCRAVLEFSTFGANQNHPINVNFSNASGTCPAHFKDRLTKFISILKSSPYLNVSDGDLFATVRLRPEFSGAANREALKKAIINSLQYPLIFGKDLKWAEFLLQSGWNTLEKDHVWSKDKSTLLLPVPKDCSKRTCFADLRFNIFGSSATRPVVVEFNTVESDGIWHKELTSVNENDYSVLIPLNSLNGSQEIEISLPKATSPHAIGISDDMRTLGICLQRIDFIKK